MTELTCAGNDWEGCVEGRWYEPCEHEQCTGWCEHAGDCECAGCGHENCCRNDRGGQ